MANYFLLKSLIYSPVERKAVCGDATIFIIIVLRAEQYSQASMFRIRIILYVDPDPASEENVGFEDPDPKYCMFQPTLLIKRN